MRALLFPSRGLLSLSLSLFLSLFFLHAYFRATCYTVASLSFPYFVAVTSVSLQRQGSLCLCPRRSAFRSAAIAPSLSRSRLPRLVLRPSPIRTELRFVPLPLGSRVGLSLPSSLTSASRSSSSQLCAPSLPLPAARSPATAASPPPRVSHGARALHSRCSVVPTTFPTHRDTPHK